MLLTMEKINLDKTYISFLEAINKALDIESIYQDTFQIIYKLFNPSRVQLWEKIANVNEMSIFYDYFESDEVSMLKFRVSGLPDSTKKIFEQTNLWEYQEITNETLTKYNIDSLVGIEFNLPGQNKGILILTSKEKIKKYSTGEIKFLTKLKKELENGLFKVEKYQKSQDELRRLQNQNNKLREQDRLRTNFINNISHEFRTPLASILGFSKMLTSKNPTFETAREITEQIQQAAQRLSTLVTDFLQINKIDTESWLAHYEPCDIGELIKQTVEEFSPLNKNYKISYLVSDNYPIIKTDPKLVRQVLDNLISNAIKYSPLESKIIVSLQVPHSEKELKVSVIDYGLGIDKEDLSKVFTRFYRSNNPKVQKVAGSGLGLAICKEIITTLNGNIEVESEINKGSKFVFTLPIS